MLTKDDSDKESHPPEKALKTTSIMTQKENLEAAERLNAKIQSEKMNQLVPVQPPLLVKPPEEPELPVPANPDNEDENLNSDDDPSEEDNRELDTGENVLLGFFTKVRRV